MSNFLNNLVGRTRGTLGVIQPRLPSLFEPSRRGEGFGTWLGATKPYMQATATVTPHDRQRPSPSSLPGIERPKAQPEPDLEGPWRAESRPPVLVPHRVVPPDPEEAISRRTAPDNLTIARVSATSQNPGQAAASGGFPALTGLPGGRDQQRAAAPHIHRTFFGNSAVNRELRTALGSRQTESGTQERPSHPQPEMTRTEISTPTAAGRSSVRPPVFERAGAPRTSELSPRASAAPAIQVSIGRVEVRAVFPAASVRRPAPARSRPTMSLDDYLSRHPGGRR